MALMKCPECNNDVSDKAKFCPNCGYPINEGNNIEQEIQFCMYCGEKNFITSQYCQSCGKPLATSECSSDEMGLIQNSESEQLDEFINNELSNAEPDNVSNRDVSIKSNVPVCPICGSPGIVANKRGYGLGKGVAGVIIAGPVGLLAGGIGANKLVVTCLNCGYKFER